MKIKLKYIPVVCYAAGLLIFGGVMRIVVAPIHKYFYYDRHLKRPSSGKSKGL